MHRQKVMPGLWVSLCRSASSWTSSLQLYVRSFSSNNKLRCQGGRERVDLLLARSVPGPLESRKETLMLWGLESEYDDWANGGRSN